MGRGETEAGHDRLTPASSAEGEVHRAWGHRQQSPSKRWLAGHPQAVGVLSNSPHQGAGPSQAEIQGAGVLGTWRPRLAVSLGGTGPKE